MTALLKTVHRPKPSSEFIFVSPATAEDWLLRNINNRNKKQAIIAKYSRDMQAKRWGLTDSMICFDWNGNLLNGQHRLEACVAAGVGFWTFVAFDMDPESFRYMDGQSVRKLTDHLKMEGESYTLQLSATAALLHRYKQGRYSVSDAGRKLLLSQGEIRQSLDENPDIRDSVQFMHGTCQKLLRFSGSEAVATLFHLIGTRNHGSEFANAFFEKLASGNDLSSGSPIYALREKLIAYRSIGQRKQYEIYGTYLPAWTAHVKGKRMVRLAPLDLCDPTTDITIL